MFRPHAHHGSRLANWMLMTVAMMLPLVVPQVRFVADRSLWRRRHRAIAGFLIGYLAIWFLVGIAVSFVEPTPVLAAAAFAVAGTWQLTRYKRVAMASCHRPMPLAPRGWRADRDCIRYGWMVGTYCVASCWALMFACAMAGHHLVAMVGVTAVMYAERYTRPRRRLFSGVLFGAGLLILSRAL
jgi:predicted metal-binding membrane protein